MQQMQQARDVGLPLAHEQGGAQDEDVGALGEGVGAACRGEGFAQFAHCGEEEVQFCFLRGGEGWVGGWGGER